MAKIVNIDSVHQKIALLLKEMQGEWIDCDTIEFVANATSYQGDWRKRLRELRYFGIEIDTKRRKQGKRSLSQYKLTKWVGFPKNPTRAAREYEKNRAARNKLKKAT